VGALDLRKFERAFASSNRLRTIGTHHTWVGLGVIEYGQGLFFSPMRRCSCPYFDINAAKPLCTLESLMEVRHGSEIPKT
jgi:hypothetical protein